MSRWLLSVAIITGALISGERGATACSCYGKERIEKALERADVAFRGTVIGQNEGPWSAVNSADERL